MFLLSQAETKIKNYMNNNYQSRQVVELQYKSESLEQHIMSQPSNSKGRGGFYCYDNYSYNKIFIEGLGFKGVSYKKILFSNSGEVTSWMKNNTTHPSN